MHKLSDDCAYGRHSPTWRHRKGTTFLPINAGLCVPCHRYRQGVRQRRIRALQFCHLLYLACRCFEGSRAGHIHIHAWLFQWTPTHNGLVRFLKYLYIAAFWCHWCCHSRCRAVPFIYTPPWPTSTLPVESFSSVTVSEIMLFFIACSPHSLGQLPPFWWKIYTSFIHVQWVRVSHLHLHSGLGNDHPPVCEASGLAMTWPLDDDYSWSLPVVLVLSLSELSCGIFRSLPPSCAIVALFFWLMT